jgi:hypothetical protein
MYNLSSDFDEKQIIDFYLCEIGIGPFTTNLLFAKHQGIAEKSVIINIRVSGYLSYSFEGNLHQCNAEKPHSMTGLVDFLMSDVYAVERVKNASLKLFFKPNGYLILEGDDSPDFESYLIQIRGGDIFVV